MSSVFAKVYLDEDVDLIVGDMLRSHGFYVRSTQDASRKGKLDSDQLAYAVEHGLVIITHNRVDYEAIAVEYYESGRTHAGIIISVQRTAKEITRRALLVLNRFTTEEMKNQLYYI